MIDPLVRRASGGDVGQLRELEAIARDALVDQRGGARWLATHAARDERWATSVADDVVAVAHIDDVLTGYVVAAVDGEIIRIDDVFVHPGAREVGFGDALLAAVIEAGQAAGCALVEGEALPGDRATKNLYERAGITARLIVVSRRID